MTNSLQFEYSIVGECCRMIPVNLELLSTDELRNLSEQERIEGFVDMSREELIEGLTEKYEDERTSDSLEEDKKSSLNIKNVSSFTDYRDNSEKVTQLPGVEDLPEKYEETSIHLLYKNSDWGYAFWSISTLDQNEIEEKHGVPYLVVNMYSKKGVKESYDIELSESDNEWNIGISYETQSVTAYICVEFPDGRRDTLAQSNTLELSSVYWLDHQDEMKANDSLFKVYLSLITTKTGEVINNSVVSEILSSYAKGGEV